MKRILCIAALGAVIALSAGLAGCGAIQAKINQDVQATTLPDAQAALADAQAAGDTDAAACYQDIIDFLNSLPTSGASSEPPKVVGLLSALEAGRVLAQAAQNGPQLPPIPPKLHKDCAVLIVDAQRTALTLGVDVAALSKGTAFLKAGAALKREGAALKAEAAALGAH
jgi:hypothetical protein